MTILKEIPGSNGNTRYQYEFRSFFRMKTKIYDDSQVTKVAKILYNAEKFEKELLAIPGIGPKNYKNIVKLGSSITSMDGEYYIRGWGIGPALSRDLVQGILSAKFQLNGDAQLEAFRDALFPLENTLYSLEETSKEMALEYLENMIQNIRGEMNV